MEDSTVIKREIMELLPEDTSTDIIVRLAAYVMKKIQVVRLEEKEACDLAVEGAISRERLSS